MLAFGYAQAISLGIQLVQIPIFLYFWGKELYGEWLVLTGLPATLVLLDVGVTKASENKAIRLACSSCWNEARVTIHTAQAYTLVAITFLCGVFSVASIIEWQEILKLTAIREQDISLIVICMGLIVAVALQLGVSDAKFKVLQKTPLGTTILASRRLCALLISSILLSLGSGPAKLAIVLAAFEILYLVFVELAVKKLGGSQISGIRRCSLTEFRSIVKPSISYAAFPLSQALTLQGGIQLVNSLIGPAGVVVYTMCRTMVRVILQVGMVANNALKPEISRLAGLGRHKEIFIIQRRAAIAAALFSICSLTIITATGPKIIEIWSHGKAYADRLDIFLIGLHAVFNLTWIVPASIDIALNKHGRIANGLALASVVSMIVWYMFRFYIEPQLAAGIALAIPELVALIIVVFRITKKSKFQYLEAE